MTYRISKLVCVLLLFALVAPMLFLTGCGRMSPEEYESYINGYSNHMFNFNTPENWDTLSPDQQVKWGKANGFLVIQSFDGDVAIFNYHLLDEFLENRGEEKELLILSRYYYEDYYDKGEHDVVSLSGIYYDGESYYADPLFASSEEYYLQKYKKCGIETDADTGKRYLYVANDFSFTHKDVGVYFSSSYPDSDVYKRYHDFDKKYNLIASIGKAK